MSVELFYIAGDLGATVRGAAILKALGHGRLVTEYREVALREGVAWFGSPPVRGDVFIWDREGRIPKRAGLQVSIGIERDVDLVVPLDVPIVPRQVDELDLYEAEVWWAHAVQRIEGPGHVREMPMDPSVRRLMCGSRDAAAFVDDPQVRVVGPGYGFYWPAMELMPLAEQVLGGEQTAGELAVLQGEADPDGARMAASAIKALIDS